MDPYAVRKWMNGEPLGNRKEASREGQHLGLIRKLRRAIRSLVKRKGGGSMT